MASNHPNVVRFHGCFKDGGGGGGGGAVVVVVLAAAAQRPDSCASSCRTAKAATLRAY